MELCAAIEKRCSIRKYKPDPVPEDVLNDILQRAAEAPSAGGLRSYHVIVTEQKLTPYTSPVSLVVCALPEKSAKRYGSRGRFLYSIQDATIYAAYIQLLAVDVGLDTVWVGAFRENKVKKILGIEDRCRPVVILPIGYRA